MSLFSKVKNAKAAAGGSYAKAGRYWVVIEYAKFDKHQMKSNEYVAFETKVIHVLDGADKIKDGEPMSFVFLDGVKGNEARLKAFIMTAMGCKEEDIDEAAMTQLVDPAAQPMKDICLEIYSTPQKTLAGKDIVASKAVRRVWAEEVQTTVKDAVKNEVFGGGRLAKMIEKEKAERSA